LAFPLLYVIRRRLYWQRTLEWLASSGRSEGRAPGDRRHARL